MTEDLILTCRPSRSGYTLIFTYSLTNSSAQDLYVMDASPRMDAKTRQYRADPHAVTVIAAEDGTTLLGKFIAPLPLDRQMAVPIIPLASLLPAGATIERAIEIAMPLAETSPYFADLPLRGYQIKAITATLFTIGFWRAGSKGLVAAPVPFAPDYYIVITPDAARDAEYKYQRFPTTSLEVMMRLDTFPRPINLADIRLGSMPQITPSRTAV